MNIIRRQCRITSKKTAKSYQFRIMNCGQRVVCAKCLLCLDAVDAYVVASFEQHCSVAAAGNGLVQN
jgi:hypothetical protein